MITSTATDYPFETESTHEKLKNAALAAQEKAQEALATGEEYVRANPVPIMLGALLIGVILAAVLRPRDSKAPPVHEGIREWLASCPHELISGEKADAPIPIKSPLREQLHDIADRVRFWRIK